MNKIEEAYLEYKRVAIESGLESPREPFQGTVDPELLEGPIEKIPDVEDLEKELGITLHPELRDFFDSSFAFDIPFWFWPDPVFSFGCIVDELENFEGSDFDKNWIPLSEGRGNETTAFHNQTGEFLWLRLEMGDWQPYRVTKSLLELIERATALVKQHGSAEPESAIDWDSLEEITRPDLREWLEQEPRDRLEAVLSLPCGCASAQLECSQRRWTRTRWSGAEFSRGFSVIGSDASSQGSVSVDNIESGLLKNILEIEDRGCSDCGEWWGLRQETSSDGQQVLVAAKASKPISPIDVARQRLSAPINPAEAMELVQELPTDERREAWDNILKDLPRVVGEEIASCPSRAPLMELFQQAESTLVRGPERKTLVRLRARVEQPPLFITVVGEVGEHALVYHELEAEPLTLMGPLSKIAFEDDPEQIAKLYFTAAGSCLACSLLEHARVLLEYALRFHPEYDLAQNELDKLEEQNVMTSSWTDSLRKRCEDFH